MQFYLNFNSYASNDDICFNYSNYSDNVIIYSLPTLLKDTIKSSMFFSFDFNSE